MSLNCLRIIQFSYSLNTKFLIIFFQSLEYVALYVDVVLDTGSLQILHASRGTSDNEHRTTIQILEGRNSVLSILATDLISGKVGKKPQIHARMQRSEIVFE